MPEHQDASPIRLLSDIRLEMHSDRGEAALHLHGDLGGLVLDVDNPVAVARVLGRRRGAPLPAEVVDLFGATAISVRSRGRDLGRVRLTSNGGVRIRPTAAGVLTAAGSIAPIRWMAVAAGPALAVLAAIAYRRRR